MTFYDQQAQKETKYACSVYAFLNILKVDFGIEVPLDRILETVAYLEDKGKLLKWGAYASVIFPALVFYVNWKLKLKLVMKKDNIYNLNDKQGYILGFKKASRDYLTLAKDKLIDEKDIARIKEKGGGYGHFHMWKKGHVFESLGGFYYLINKATLESAAKQDLYYESVRYFVPGDKKTEQIQKRLIGLVKRKGVYIDLAEYKRLYP